MSQPRILVVDDEPGMLHSLERVLGQGHAVSTSSSPRRALELAASFAPDLAILDIRMPEMDGFELMRQLKRAWPDLDVILMTGSVDELDRKLARAIREEAFYFIQKPFHREVLLTLVTRCLTQRRLTEQNRAHVRRLEAELAEARAFQEGLLPPGEAELEGIRLAARCIPCAELGGDYYDYAAAGGGRVALLVADVSGHGASAAMLTGVVRAAFHSAAAAGYDPVAVLRRIAAMIRPFGADRFVTAFAGRMAAGEPGRSATLEYASAGHPPALLWGGGRRPVFLGPTSPLISPALDGTDWIGETVALARDDRLLIYTDGLEDACGDSGTAGMEEVLALAEKHSEAGAAWLDIVLELIAQRGAERGRGREDDVTLLTAHFSSSP